MLLPCQYRRYMANAARHVTDDRTSLLVFFLVEPGDFQIGIK